MFAYLWNFLIARVGAYALISKIFGSDPGGLIVVLYVQSRIAAKSALVVVDTMIPTLCRVLVSIPDMQCMYLYLLHKFLLTPVSAIALKLILVVSIAVR